jgi:hypothetical protein
MVGEGQPALAIYEMLWALEIWLRRLSAYALCLLCPNAFTISTDAF